MEISIVVLTYNRPKHVVCLIRELLCIGSICSEIVIVDNNSDCSIDEFLGEFSSKIKLIKLESNIGIGGRNVGILNCTNDIVITIDDDIYGLDEQKIIKILSIFNDENLAAVCFRVVDYSTKKIINWCHHYPVEKFKDREFLTNEISEGAVAFRRDAIIKVGMYADYFFISHEGPDLACRLLDAGYDIKFSPDVEVLHKHASEGRTSWRRYYFDTRNLLWLVTRNYPLWYGTKKYAIGILSLLLYSLRDGYFRYWLRGVRDSLIHIKRPLSERHKLSDQTMGKIKEIMKHRTQFWVLVRKRIFQRQIRI